MSKAQMTAYVPSPSTGRGSPYFKPYEGSSYGSGLFGDGLKVLVLGESHYEGKDGPVQPSDMGKWSTQYMDGDRAQARFWDGITRLFGVDPDDSGKRTLLWSSIALHNLIQCNVPGETRRPSSWMWREAQQPFKTVLDDLQPNIVLVLGKVNWNHLHGDRATDRELPELTARLLGRSAWSYAHARGVSIASWVYHPSRRGFNATDERPHVEALLEAARVHFQRDHCD